jgi:ABC-type Zn uptake system ZnuABC Zn-binding protein ZnuA
MDARRLAATLGIALASALAACSGSNEGANGRPVTAVATTTQVADFVREVGGARVYVHQILKPNSDPHEYEPRPSDATAVNRAQLVFQSGGDLDGWLDDVVTGGGGKATVVKLLDSVRTRKGPERGSNATDPHWWQDPRNAERAVRPIRDALSRADPAGRATYARNAHAYIARLRALDRGIAACMARVPSAERKLVTTHDALGYYAARYGIQVVGALIPSLSTQAQPSARDIQRLVDQIRRERVRAIFPETALNPKLERAVSREAGAKVGGRLWSDSLGPEGSDGATYLEAMAHNTATLTDGFTGGAVRCRPQV